VNRGRQGCFLWDDLRKHSCVIHQGHIRKLYSGIYTEEREKRFHAYQEARSEPYSCGKRVSHQLCIKTYCVTPRQAYAFSTFCNQHFSRFNSIELHLVKSLCSIPLICIKYPHRGRDTDIGKISHINHKGPSKKLTHPPDVINW